MIQSATEDVNKWVASDEEAALSHIRLDELEHARHDGYIEWRGLDAQAKGRLIEEERQREQDFFANHAMQDSKDLFSYTRQKMEQSCDGVAKYNSH